MQLQRSSEQNEISSLSSPSVCLADYSVGAVCIRSEEPQGDLNIGSLQTMSVLYMPEFLKMYLEKYPKVRLSLRVGHTEDMVQKVLNHELDGAFVSGAILHLELEKKQVLEETLVIITREKELSHALLKDMPMLTFQVGCSYRNLLEAWLKSEGITQPRVMEFGTLGTILGGVKAGLGMSLLPEKLITKYPFHEQIYSHSIPEPFSIGRCYFIYRRDRYTPKSLLAMLDLFHQFSPFCT